MLRLPSIRLPRAAGRSRAAKASGVRTPAAASCRAGSRVPTKNPLASLRPPWRGFGSKSRSPAPSIASDASEGSEASLDTQCSADSSVAPVFWEDGETYLRWFRALAGRSVTELPAEELRKLVRSGMPLKHRLTLWPQWFVELDIQDIEGLQQNIPEDVARLIDLDVPRTLPQWLHGHEEDSLRRILRAHAAINPALGYCQGINNIAAVFVVLGFDEVTALRGLCTLLQTCCADYHSCSLGGFRLDALVLDALVRRLLPESTAKALEMLSVPLDVLASEHFLSLAARTWPLAATVQLWDLLLMEGAPALFASFLAVLELHLPNEDEQLALEGALAAGGPDADEPVVVFRQGTLRGVREDFGSILERVHELLEQLPMSLIEHYRFVFGRDNRF